MCGEGSKMLVIFFPSIPFLHLPFILLFRTVASPFGAYVKIGSRLLLWKEPNLVQDIWFKVQCELVFSPYLPHWLDILNKPWVRQLYPAVLFLPYSFSFRFFLPSSSSIPPSSYYACPENMSPFIYGHPANLYPALPRTVSAASVTAGNPCPLFSCPESLHFWGCQRTLPLPKSISNSSLAEGF